MIANITAAWLTETTLKQQDITLYNMSVLVDNIMGYNDSYTLLIQVRSGGYTGSKFSELSRFDVMPHHNSHTLFWKSLCKVQYL